MDYIKPVEIDLNEMDDEPFRLYYEKQAKKEQFTRQLACILNKLLDSGQEMQNNRCSPTTGLQE